MSQHEDHKDRPSIERDTNYWLSLEHYQQDPEFLKLAETEFQSSPLREGEKEDGFARRDFLKLMGASIAMASAGCLRRPVEKIVPYNKQPEEVTLGIPNFYTSTYFDGTEAIGVLMKTREGRPIKVEGQGEQYPLNKGASITSQAAILNLYDPERLRGPQKNLFNEKRTNKDTISTNWATSDKEIVEQLKKGGVVVLTGGVSGPANNAMVDDFCKAFGAKHVSFEALSNDDFKIGQKAAYGEASVPFYRFDKARMIISIDADFLGTWMAPTTYTRQFSEGRGDNENMSRLVVFDSNYSLTGANADIRIKIKPSLQLTAVMGLLHELIVKKGVSSYSGNASLKNALGKYANAPQALGIEPALLEQIAADLWENRGRSLIVAGGLAAWTSHSTELQTAVALLNTILDSEGKTIIGKAGGSHHQASWADMLTLIADMKEGKVKTLIMDGVNPSYVLNPRFGFDEAIRKVEMVVSTADRMDETAQHAQYVMPASHPFESWGDSEAATGFYAIQQPTIRPMYDTRDFNSSLLTWAQLAKQGSKRLLESKDFYEYLRATWKEVVHSKVAKGRDFEDFWLDVLEKGYAGEVPSSGGARSLNAASLSALDNVMPAQETEIVLYVANNIGDGLRSNVSWIHELPDPVSKIVWDNYANVSIGFAKKHGLKEAQLIDVTVGGESITLPVHIQPGLHDGVISVAVGYGRTRGGKVTNGVGKNAYTLIAGDAKKLMASGQAVTFKKVPGFYELANPQGHHSMEGRQIVVEATLKEYLKKRDANIHRHHVWSIWSGHQYNGHKWGMAIDLNSCTGCNACVLSCQTENNIPVVGKKYVLQGREMHWLRIDRYYVGTPENAEIVFQPVMCQHCDNAPCETVCPVVATSHTDDGLNSMTYNRCVGTRYCANNCPYKVRRFNWFNWRKEIEKPTNMALNPDVTVRIRGVMEKCTFCVQRIHAGKNAAKAENRELKDGEIKTACQTACPSGGIIFGDMNDPNSQVSKHFKEQRAYALLEEWHAAPAVRYMTKIRNNGQDARHADKGEHA